jgi:hypothetical protein
MSKGTKGIKKYVGDVEATMGIMVQNILCFIFFQTTKCIKVYQKKTLLMLKRPKTNFFGALKGDTKFLKVFTR